MYKAETKRLREAIVCYFHGAILKHVQVLMTWSGSEDVVISCYCKHNSPHAQRKFHV